MSPRLPTPLRGAAPIVLVTALVAVLGLAGTAGAARLITGSSIKDGSITAADLSKKTRTALKGAAGARGIAGHKGDRGSAGPMGMTGTAGAAGAAGVNGVAGAPGVAGSNGPQGTTGGNGTNGALALTPLDTSRRSPRERDELSGTRVRNVASSTKSLDRHIHARS